jgi:hypothetical protein
MDATATCTRTTTPVRQLDCSTGTRRGLQAHGGRHSRPHHREEHRGYGRPDGTTFWEIGSADETRAIGRSPANHGSSTSATGWPRPSSTRPCSAPAARAHAPRAVPPPVAVGTADPCCAEVIHGWSRLADVGACPDPGHVPLRSSRLHLDAGRPRLRCPTERCLEGLAAPNQRSSRRKTPGGQVTEAIKGNRLRAVPDVSGSQDLTTGPSDAPTT